MLGHFSAEVDSDLAKGVPIKGSVEDVRGSVRESFENLF